MFKFFFSYFILVVSFFLTMSKAKEALVMTPNFDLLFVERVADDEEFEFGYTSASTVVDQRMVEFMDYAKYITKGLGFSTKITFKVDDQELYIEVNHRYDHQYYYKYKRFDEL
ncbi:unnamed protein product [Absidia cylindrospora]